MLHSQLKEKRRFARLTVAVVEAAFEISLTLGVEQADFLKSFAILPILATVG